MSPLKQYKTWQHLKTQWEVQRITQAWTSVPARTMRQIRENVGHVVDTLPVPKWNLTFGDKMFAVGLWVELVMLGRLLK